jgi:predicted small secreted protein
LIITVRIFYFVFCKKMNAKTNNIRLRKMLGKIGKYLVRKKMAPAKKYHSFVKSKSFFRESERVENDVKSSLISYAGKSVQKQTSIPVQSDPISKASRLEQLGKYLVKAQFRQSNTLNTPQSTISEFIKYEPVYIAREMPKRSDPRSTSCQNFRPNNPSHESKLSVKKIVIKPAATGEHSYTSYKKPFYKKNNSTVNVQDFTQKMVTRKSPASSDKKILIPNNTKSPYGFLDGSTFPTPALSPEISHKHNFLYRGGAQKIYPINPKSKKNLHNKSVAIIKPDFLLHGNKNSNLPTRKQTEINASNTFTRES